MNNRILDSEVQEYINGHLRADVHRIAMAKSPFEGVSGTELAGQIAAKNKCAKKLSSWYQREGIYYPALLSVEQSSSETTAQYKAGLILKGDLADLTGGFGVDSHYFTGTAKSVTHCEINEELSAIAAHNARVFGQGNIRFVAEDGLKYLRSTDQNFNTIYIDPARRSSSGKVFMLKDCTPDVTENMPLLLSKTNRIIIKTAPLLDITAGLKELSQVSEIHILSIKNECKELLWIIDRDIPTGHSPKIVAITLNETIKTFSFLRNEEQQPGNIPGAALESYLYEPDAALLKTGAFNLIADTYQIKKLQHQTQLYTSDRIHMQFPGRIFKIQQVISAGELKREKELTGNVIVRNYPEKAESLVKKYKIRPGQKQFLIFCQTAAQGNTVIRAEIIQHY